MAHMVAVPAPVVGLKEKNDTRWPLFGAGNASVSAEPSRYTDWFMPLQHAAAAANHAELGYDLWLPHTDPWLATSDKTPSKGLAGWLLGERAPEAKQKPTIEALHLTCCTSSASTPMSARNSATAAAPCASVRTVWARTSSATAARASQRCDTPRGMRAPRTVRSATAVSTTSASCSSIPSSSDLLRSSPTLMLPRRPRGLTGLQQSEPVAERPREPNTEPPPLADGTTEPEALQPPSVAPSPSFLMLELEQNVSVADTKIEDGIGLYEVTWSDKTDTIHTVWRRYSDFDALHTSLCDDRAIGEIVESIAFPPKRPLSSFSRAQRERLLEERKDDLEDYLAKLVLEGIVNPSKLGRGPNAAGERLGEFLGDNASLPVSGNSSP